MKRKLMILLFSTEPINRTAYIIRQLLIWLIFFTPLYVLANSHRMLVEILIQLGSYTYMFYAIVIIWILLGVWVHFANIFRRLQHLAKPNWYLILSMLPGVGLFFLAYLALAPGKVSIVEQEFIYNKAPNQAIGVDSENIAKKEKTLPGPSRRVKTPFKVFSLVLILLLLFNAYQYFRYQDSRSEIEIYKQQYLAEEKSYNALSKPNIPKNFMIASSAERKYFDLVKSFNKANDFWILLNLFGVAIFILAWAFKRKGDDKLLRVITQLINTALLLFSLFMFYHADSDEKKIALFLGIIALFNLLSLFNAIGFSSWLEQKMQRRMIEEQIKTIEAEKRLVELQKQLADSRFGG